MTTATLAGANALSVTLQIPAWGVWWATVGLDAEVSLSGAATLVLADLELSGAIVSGGVSNGRSRYRVAAGAGAWGAALPAKGYVNDAGVAIATVIVDAATECGETFDASTASGYAGPAYAREAAPAARVLETLAPRAWYVDADGTTKLGARSGAELSTSYTRGEYDAAVGRLELAADEIATILPGSMVDGRAIADVEHTLEPGKLRTVVWFNASPCSRVLRAWRAIAEQVDPRARFRGVYDYRVVFQVGERFDLQAVRVSSGMPDLRGVRLRPGVAGCRADVELGSIVLVAFADGDPSRPCVVAFDDPDAAGFAPSRLDLVGADDAGVDPTGAIGRVVRYGDPITFAAPGPGTVVLPATGSLSRVRA